MTDAKELTQLTIEIDPSDKLLTILRHRKTSMKVCADSHEYLYNTYRITWIVITVVSAVIAGGSFAISAIGGARAKEEGSDLYTALAILTGITMIVTGITSKWNFAKMYEAHHKSMIAAVAMYQDLDFALARSPSSGDLHTLVETFTEKIKTFRETEEPVPWTITHKFLTDQ